MSAKQKRRRAKRRRHATAAARRRNRVLAGAGIAVGATLSGPAAAEADTIIVNNLGDDATLGSGTLRAAVEEAELTPEFDRVLFESGLSGTITLQDAQGGEIDIDYPVEITGPGPGRVTVDGDNDQRIFDIEGPYGQLLTKVTIEGLTLTNGYPGSDGGAIRSYAAELTVLDSVITGNFADGTGGGIGGYYTNLRLDSTTVSGNGAEYGGGVGLDFGSQSTINDSTIAGNYAYEGGGGVRAYVGSSLLITGSTISGNTAIDEDGGGIFSFLTDTTVSNSTITGNQTLDESGGGISSVDYGAPFPSKLTVRSSTIAGNAATDDGGGIDADGYMHVLLLNSIVATNTAATSGPNIDNRLPNESVEAGFTLIDDPTDAQITETTPGSNIFGLNPQLSPLASNGGPTQTMALSNTSPALDKGDSFGAKQDQRAQTRPIDLPGIAASAAPGADSADIGAFELQSLPAAAAAAALECRGEPATIVAQSGVPTQGTNGKDVIVGTTGPDEIRGRGGKDLICGWDGEDRLFGGAGNDTVFGQRDDDFAKGQAGRDRLGGGPGEDKLLGGKGRDGLTGGRGPDTLIGGDGLDRLFGKAGRDRMFGNDGPDRLFGGPAADRFDGGPGRNILHLIRGDGDEVVGQNASELVLISDRAKRKQP
jgi:Ca2+-binding RTX toxin-like protein